MGKVLVGDVFKITQGHESRIIAVEKDIIGIRGEVKENTEDILCIKKDQKESHDFIEKRMRLIEAFTIEAGVTLRAVRWVGALLAAGLLGLIVSISTGKATVIFH